MNLINKINEGKDSYINYENTKKITNNNIIQEKNFLEKYHNDGIDLNLYNKNQIESLKINLEKIKSYKPSKYKKLENKEVEEKKKLNEIIQNNQENSKKIGNENNNDCNKNNNEIKLDKFEFFNDDDNNNITWIIL